MDWKNLGEQIAHFALLGAVPAYFSVELAIAVLCVRELSGWRWLPWPIRGQWPPKDYRPDRVEDLRLDVIVTLAGMAAGHALSRVWWIL